MKVTEKCHYASLVSIPCSTPESPNDGLPKYVLQVMSTLLSLFSLRYSRSLKLISLGQIRLQGTGIAVSIIGCSQHKVNCYSASIPYSRYQIKLTFVFFDNIFLRGGT
jgi:hypothetical protein